MKELKLYIGDEIETFREKFNGSKIAIEILESLPSFDTWLDCKRQQIMDYYKTIHKDDKLSIVFCKQSFKIRLTFLNDGRLSLNLEYIHSQNAVIKEKRVMQEYKSDPGYVYFIESEFGWKIGKTRDLRRRKNIFEVKLPFKFAIRYCIKTPIMNDLEKYFHEYFKDKNINGEWFLITNDDIKNCVLITPEHKLQSYHQESSHFIDKKYLQLITNLPASHLS